MTRASKVSGIEPGPYVWDFDGACAPYAAASRPGQHRLETFSVGVFRWLPKAGGHGVKRGNVIRRFTGSTADPESVYARARAFVEYKTALFGEHRAGRGEGS